MKRAMSVAAGLTLLLATAGCGQARDAGPATTAHRTVSGVHAVQLETSGDLTINVGEGESLTIDAGANVIDGLTSDVVDGTLVLGGRSGSWFGGSIRYTLTVTELDRIGGVVAQLQFFVDDDAHVQRPAQHARAAEAGDGEDAGDFRAAAARLQQLVRGDDHRQVAVTQANQQVGAGFLGDAGKRAVPRRTLVAQDGADDEIRARRDRLQRRQIRVRARLDDRRIRQPRDDRRPVVRAQFGAPAGGFGIPRAPRPRHAIADQPVPAPDQIGPGHRLRDGILGVHDATRVSPGGNRG